MKVGAIAAAVRGSVLRPADLDLSCLASAPIARRSDGYIDTENGMTMISMCV